MVKNVKKNIDVALELPDSLYCFVTFIPKSLRLKYESDIQKLYVKNDTEGLTSRLQEALNQFLTYNLSVADMQVLKRITETLRLLGYEVYLYEKREEDGEYVPFETRPYLRLEPMVKMANEICTEIDFPEMGNIEPEQEYGDDEQEEIKQNIKFREMTL